MRQWGLKIVKAEFVRAFGEKFLRFVFLGGRGIFPLSSFEMEKTFGDFVNVKKTFFQKIKKYFP